MKKIILSIDGMTCSACSNGLEKYLNRQNGIQNAVVNLVMANATIEYDENLLTQKQLEEFVKQAGFKSLGEFKEITFENKSKKEKQIFIVFTIFAIILMYISMGHMINLAIPSFLDINKNPNNYMICLLVLATCFIIYGFDILKNGWKNLIHKTPNMDTLVGIGVITSFLYSLYNMYLVLIGNHHHIMNLYFESSAIVIYFIKLGRYIDGVSRNKTKEAIQKLVEITPNKAILKIDGKEVEVTLDEIHKGDIVVSKAGQKIAVDGEIVVGEAHFDESFLTGESKPTSKKIGDTVLAGSLNYDGYIEYKAQKIGKESTVSEIVKLVVEASNTKTPITKVADKVSSYFVPTIILISILTFIIYLVFGQNFETAFIPFVTILVVACPCSLGLATPLAIIVSGGLCATNGILIKNSEILESARKVDTIVFDKTGTLTYGKLKIDDIINYSQIDNEKLLQIVGSIEAKSHHPIAVTFTDYLKEKGISLLDVKDFEEISGYGVIGKINHEIIILGNSKILEKFQIPNTHLDDEKKLSGQENSIIYVVKDKRILALIGVNDVLRSEAKEVISSLSNMNIQSIMLTGDHEKTAKRIADKIGITNIKANVVPSEKADMIKKLKKNKNYIMMCGDGINDSPALANADIGVSFHSGTDIAMDSSDVILTKNDLKSIINLINISKKTVTIIKQNLFWAFFYNCLMVPVAMGIFKPFGISINPMLASAAMVLSSITVILNTLRLKRKVN